MSNEPYKSRLFNFLNRQNIRWQDKLGINVRRLRSTTEMGIQLMLYPFYLMVQSGRVVRQRLEDRVQSSLLLPETKSSKSDSSSITTASVPLDEVLNLVEPWLEAKENSDSIATNTIDVLPVNQEDDLWQNQPSLPQRQKQPLVTSTQLDNISPNIAPASSQGSRLIQGIASVLGSREVVLIDRDNRILNVLNPTQQQILEKYLATTQQKPSLVTTTTQKVLASLPEVSSNYGASVAPVKFFGQMVDWLQKSPIATKFNLFGESNLALNNTIYPQASFLVSLDNKVANLETRSGLYNSISANKLAQYSQTKIEIDSNPFQISAIIQAAIDYFFAKNNSSTKNKIKGSSPFTLPDSNSHISLESKTVSSYLPGESSGQNSWLSWSDIFSNTISSTVKSRSLEQENKMIQPQESTPLFSLPQEKTQDFTGITKTHNSTNSLDTNSDLLETKATSLGYEKHPLVRMLEILDGIIVWVEERLVKIWRKFP